jgi:prolyl-tRNA editing enzyme YbaK/EbsC (Cys-tRNA(Pro) deacylase)
MAESESRERVRAALVEAGISAELVVLACEVPTAATAADALGCEVGAICNSLVFTADGEPVLVLASGGHRVDTAVAAAAFGVSKLRRAEPDVVFIATGQVVGGCAPLGHPAPLRTLIDSALADYPVLWAGGGDKETMMRTTFADLIAMTGGTVIAW